MANKKGFVRYANNKLVAGSLILADKAPKVGVWKEIAYDLCCDSVCPECPQCFQANTTYTVTEEQLADATGNTGIIVNVLDIDFITQDNIPYYIQYGCYQFSHGFGGGPGNYTYCGSATTVFYFKNDAPVFIPGITTNLCTS